MKFRFAALAAALALSSIGCTAIQPGAGCGDEVVCGSACAGHVATSQMAPRASGLAGRLKCSLMPGCQIAPGELKGCLQDACGCNSGYGICNQMGNCDYEGCLQKGINGVLGGCGGCGPHGGCPACDASYNFNPGPPVGQTAYPYYTTRGPRDFLMANPPSIGPR